MVTFNQPLLLLVTAGLVVGWLLLGALWRRNQLQALDHYGDREILSRFSHFTSSKPATILLTLALISAGLAAADPVLTSNENASTPTLNAIIVMDISRSMLAEDGADGTTRLETGVAAIKELFAAYPDGRFGLVLYTARVLTYPPSTDHQALSFILDDILENYAVRGEGSEPIAALQDVGMLLEEIPNRVETVIVIADGGQSLAEGVRRPLLTPVMEQLRSLGVRIVVAGVGGLVPAAIPVYNDSGQLVGYHQFQGVTVYTTLDEIPLRRFALETSGWYLRLAEPDDLLELVVSEDLDSQPTEQATIVNLAWLPAAVSLLLVTVWLLSRTVTITIPRFH